MTHIMITSIWVMLPSLPVEFWNQIIYEGIIDSFGKLIFVEYATKASSRLTKVRMCIMVNLGTKIPSTITLKSKLEDHSQKIRYEQNIFLCSICTQVGHNEKSSSARISIKGDMLERRENQIVP